MGEVFSVIPSIGLEERYDSNPRLRPESGSVTDDYVTSVVPQIEITRDKEALKLNGSYRLATRYYSNQPELSYISHNASVGMSDALTQTTKITVLDSFSLTDDSLETAESAKTKGIAIQRTRILSNDASIAMSHDFNPLFSANIRYSDVLYKFEDPNLIDSRADSFLAESRWNQARNRVITATYGYTYFSFENSEKNSVDEHSLTLGLEERLSPTFRVNLSGGAAYVRDINARFFSTGRAELLKNFSGSSLSLSYSRSATTSFGLTNEININDTVSLSCDTSLSRDFKVSISGDYSQNRTEPTALLDVKSFDATIKGEWTPDRWIKVGMGYSHFNQWGTGPSDEDIKREQVFVSLTAITEGWRF